MYRSVILFALLTTSVPALAQNGPPSGGGPPGGGEGPGGMDRPMRPMKPPKPLKRATFDKEVTALFGKGDTDRDGVVTVAELQAAIDAKRDVVIQARFRSIDQDGNGSIGAPEFFAWQRQMGTAALSDQQASPRATEIVAAFIEPDLGDDEDDRMMRTLIEPLSSTMLVKVNTNYDGGATLAELLAYQGARFEAADLNSDAEISFDEFRPRGPGGNARPGPPGGGPGGGPN